MEYAIERRILETPILDMSYYADVAGDVPSLQEQAKSVSWEPFDIGNGDVAPEWGFDIIVRGGFLRYGPWADRQRFEVVDFQICHVSLIVCPVWNCSECFSLPHITISHRHNCLRLETRGFGRVSRSLLS
jgi:hypothetical protein